jgi:hypothetical protein
VSNTTLSEVKVTTADACLSEVNLLAVVIYELAQIMVWITLFKFIHRVTDQWPVI